jgi:hypothetical protein
MMDYMRRGSIEHTVMSEPLNLSLVYWTFSFNSNYYFFIWCESKSFSTLAYSSFKEYGNLLSVQCSRNRIRMDLHAICLLDPEPGNAVYVMTNGVESRLVSPKKTSYNLSNQFDQVLTSGLKFQVS